MDFGRPPDNGFDVHPSREDIDFFREHGYLVVERITTDEEIAWLRVIFEYIFAPDQADHPDAPVDRSGTLGPDEEPRLTQAFFPEVRFPALLEATHRRNARRFAAALLDVPESALSSWGHMIRKAPGGKAALWHQDHAYWEPELDYHALGVWLPLHDVSVEMGAMQFIPGSHRLGLLPHRHDDAPEKNVLTVMEPVDESRAVACPLPAGGVTFHHAQTLHYTAPNTTDRPRLAYPMEFQCKPVRRAEPRVMPWVDELRAATGRDGRPLTYVADGELIEV